jgi:Asp-tRNA(Asn)/Glu-tRNA(Gln) amidotransferase B subunit
MNARTDLFLDKYRELEVLVATVYNLPPSASAVVYLLQRKEFRGVKSDLELCKDVRNLLSHNPKINGRYAVEPSEELIALLDAGKIRMDLVKSTLEKMLDTGKPASAFIKEEDMGGLDDAALRTLCEEAIANNPKAAADYRSGKAPAIKAILGGVMRAAKGRADAKTVEAMLAELLG